MVKGKEEYDFFVLMDEEIKNAAENFVKFCAGKILPDYIKSFANEF